MSISNLSRPPVIAVPYKVTSLTSEYQPNRFLNGIILVWLIVTLLLGGVGVYFADQLKAVYSVLWPEIYKSVQANDRNRHAVDATHRSIVGTNLLMIASGRDKQFAQPAPEDAVVERLAQYYRAVDSGDFGHCRETLQPDARAAKFVTYCYRPDDKFPFQVRIPVFALPEAARLSIRLGYIGLRQAENPCLIDSLEINDSKHCQISVGDGGAKMRFEVAWVPHDDHYIMKFRSSSISYFPELVNFRVDVQRAQSPHGDLYAFFDTTNYWIVDTARKRLLEIVTKNPQEREALLHRYRIRQRNTQESGGSSGSQDDTDSLLVRALRAIGWRFPHAIYMQSFDEQYHLLYAKFIYANKSRTVDAPVSFTSMAVPQLYVSVFTPLFMFAYGVVSVVILGTVVWGQQHRKKYHATLVALEQANADIKALKATIRDQPERYTRMLTRNNEGLHIIRHEISKMLRREDLERRSWDLVLDYYRCISTVSLCLNPQQQIFREITIGASFK